MNECIQFYSILKCIFGDLYILTKLNLCYGVLHNYKVENTIQRQTHTHTHTNLAILTSSYKLTSHISQFSSNNFTGRNTNGVNHTSQKLVCIDSVTYIVLVYLSVSFLTQSHYLSVLLFPFRLVDKSVT